MTTRRGSAAIVLSLVLLATIVAAFYRQAITGWLRPAPPPPPEKLTIAVINTYIGSGLVLIASAKG